MSLLEKGCKRVSLGGDLLKERAGRVAGVGIALGSILGRSRKSTEPDSQENLNIRGVFNVREKGWWARGNVGSSHANLVAAS